MGCTDCPKAEVGDRVLKHVKNSGLGHLEKWLFDRGHFPPAATFGADKGTPPTQITPFRISGSAEPAELPQAEPGQHRGCEHPPPPLHFSNIANPELPTSATDQSPGETPENKKHRKPQGSCTLPIRGSHSTGDPEPLQGGASSSSLSTLLLTAAVPWDISLQSISGEALKATVKQPSPIAGKEGLNQGCPSITGLWSEVF